MTNKTQMQRRRQPALTLSNVLHVRGVVEDLGEAFQQHGRLVVAVGNVLRLLEHLIQRRRLHLQRNQGSALGTLIHEGSFRVSARD